ncbi:hypothetical protein WN944_018947 [Citrus x changshan-huyou]|uniref:non-specific serine/threonine protein kinase n=1 Tax=Citrus x changshan-huyou TaxID=2935761 RepID=A0AAP0QEN7_9ROSI
MELCEGGELFDRIVARGHYTERAAAAVMKTVVEVVQSESSSTGNEHRRRSSLESLFCYDKPIPEERIEKSIGVHCLRRCANEDDENYIVIEVWLSSSSVVGEPVILCVLNVVAVVIVHLKKMANDEHLHKAFSFFDRNQSGFIEIEELRNALNDEVDTSSEDVINAIMHDVDMDKVSV